MIADSERTIIRTFIADDLEPLYALLSDKETMRYTGFKVPQTKERTKELLTKWQKKSDNGLGTWAVVEKNSNSFIAWVMLKMTTDTEFPELGYMIYKPNTGKGFATEIAKTILDYGFGKLNLPKIVAAVSPENPASIRVLEKIGMKKTSELTHCEGGIYFQCSHPLTSR